MIQPQEYQRSKSCTDSSLTKLSNLTILHSAFARDFNSSICLFDDRNVYVWKIEEKKIHVNYDHFIRGL